MGLDLVLGSIHGSIDNIFLGVSISFDSIDSLNHFHFSVSDGSLI